ncbi:hypothetical protein N6B72_02430 [Chryseobacterium soli]|uniref:Uncharacterized protein n=1 Tax=Chryseobacterium soli TaxID=445961 RepID=A0A086A1K1_9FLAO|nr:hypothetical protein [Chryseobacterium soli]KFF10565.1 hypothetical protein IW15_19710 [Chryseobacterium soli]MDV7695768.1 hypothetical protein [Chryseobacterium soli]
MSKTTKKLMLRLAFLIVPFGILTLVLHDGQSGGQTGGGAYDLSGLVYGLALFACISVWMIWMLICYFISKTSLDRKMYLKLLLIGVIALVAAYFVTPRMF